MKRFNFRLEKLLELREFYEHKAKIELAQAIAHKNAVDYALKTIAESKIKISRKFAAGNSILDTDYLHDAQHYMIRLDKEKESLLRELVFAEKTINEKQRVYIEAAAKYKVISKLKEKKLAEWKKENNKIEDNIVDDIITFKSGRKLPEKKHDE